VGATSRLAPLEIAEPELAVPGAEFEADLERGELAALLIRR
jgi:hypothetical protein